MFLVVTETGAPEETTWELHRQQELPAVRSRCAAQGTNNHRASSSSEHALQRHEARVQFFAEHFSN